MARWRRAAAGGGGAAAATFECQSQKLHESLSNFAEMAQDTSLSLRPLPQPRLLLLVLVVIACSVVLSYSQPPPPHLTPDTPWASSTSAALDHIYALQAHLHLLF